MASRESMVAPEVAVKISTTSPESGSHDPSFSKDVGSSEMHINPATAHSAEAIARKTRTGLKSEHGHSLSCIRPMTQHPGSSVAAFFKGLFTTVIGISTLGTSVTFSYVLSGDATHPRSADPEFDLRQTQLFLAISWLLFLLALANASICSTLLTFFKDHWIADWDGMNGKTSQFEVQMYAVSAAALMGALIVGAFVLLSLVVAAYSAMIGWVALGFTAFYGLIIAMGVLQQVPWPWRRNMPTPGSNHSEC
ncbi:hypothetical protein A1O7_02570 [Cladophialophora yegresii CBS 114405]|uniref:Uncharacterized protein n=1 Tax=Cladophialophora yegresii CBS 114405 TaxID=1182544 RepID=W9W239_9EURO|nr:uncharacterized protein A1O7_02570 [Cladophialophora yegresii CBS 114405]EXJ62137.1 hypothetical protein A1O7_02570 [Cladophialophora yegresii CBS 114405]